MTLAKTARRARQTKLRRDRLAELEIQVLTLQAQVDVLHQFVRPQWPTGVATYTSDGTP